jgi:hypothetical protein
MRDGLSVFSIQAKNIVAYLLAECASIFVRSERNSENNVANKLCFHAENVRAKPGHLFLSSFHSTFLVHIVYLQVLEDAAREVP